MHEAKFTEQIVDSILNTLTNCRGNTPACIHVRVGEVFHLQKESVLFHYALLTKGTRLEPIRIDLQEEPLEVQCRQCRKTGGVEDHHLLMCPSCGSREVDVLRGNEITVECTD